MFPALSKLSQGGQILSPTYRLSAAAVRCLSDKPTGAPPSGSGGSRPQNSTEASEPGAETGGQKKADDDAAAAEVEDHINAVTGEIGGPRGPEPTRYGDWERKGRVSDF